MSRLADHVDSIRELVKDSQPAQFAHLHPPAEAEHIYYLLENGSTPGSKTWKRHEANSKPRAHQASNLSAVIEFAKRNNKAAVWFHRTAVVCLVDDEIRRDQVTVKLDFSPQLLQLLVWEKAGQAPMWMSQSQTILTLRTTFMACLGLTGNLITILRRIKFTTNAQNTGIVDASKRSIGTQLESEMQGSEIIPEYINFQVPIFSNATFRLSVQQVTAAIELDMKNGNFAIMPIPGQIENAIGDAEEAIGVELRDALKDTKVPVLYGRP